MKKRTKYIIQAIFLLGVLVFAYVLATQIQDEAFLQDWVSSFGYIGIFIASIISGVNLIVPIPIVSFVPAFVAGGLNVWLIILALSFGLSVGDLIGYAIGHIGRNISKEKQTGEKYTRKLETLAKKNRSLPLFALFFYAAFIPFPNEIIVAPLAFIGYKLQHIFPVIFVGNIIFNTLFALGALSLVPLFGV